MFDFVPKTDEKFEILPQCGVLIFVKLLNALTEFPSFVFTIYPLVTPVSNLFSGNTASSAFSGRWHEKDPSTQQPSKRYRQPNERLSQDTICIFDGEDGSFSRLFHIRDNLDR